MLKWLQFLREKNFKHTIPPVKIEDGEEITYEKATSTLRRAVHFYAALQSCDGHWPAENAGPLFFLPPFVSCTIIIIKLSILLLIYYHYNLSSKYTPLEYLLIKFELTVNNEIVPNNILASELVWLSARYNYYFSCIWSKKCRFYVFTLQDILILSSQLSIKKKFFVTYTIIRYIFLKV